MSQTASVRLKTARISKGYSNAKQFTEKHGINYTTYIKHESGRLPLTQKSTKHYAEILNVPHNWLLHGESSDSDANAQNATSISLRARAMEPVLFPFILTSILKAIGKFDDDLDYSLLYEKCKNMIAQIIIDTDDIEKAKDIIMTITSMHCDELKKSILKDMPQ